MPAIFNSKNLEFKQDRPAIDYFNIKTATPRLSQLVKSEHLEFDIRLLNPGQYSFPYHFHRHAEELMVIISGSLTLRTQDGLEIINQGDLIFFEMGKSGVHQLFNHTKEPSTYLDIKTFSENDICEYPDSGKVNISHYREVFEKKSEVDYFKGEENIKEIWNKLRDK